MNIQLFLNKKGLIWGGDNKRIGCERAGVLRIGGSEIAVSGTDCVMPLLFYGASGDFEASYATSDGEVYKLEKVAVRSGRILPPPSSAVEIMELHVRADCAEKERVTMKADIEDLRNIFDTDSLNFLIK